mgnify:CR=1 FL=1
MLFRSVVTSLLASVKKRQPLTPATDLNNRIAMLMRGEVAEKRSVERFDVDLSELESTDDEVLEEVDISDLLPDVDEAQEKISAEEEALKRRKEDKDQTHWGERATDVNYKDTQEQRSEERRVGKECRSRW